MKAILLVMGLLLSGSVLASSSSEVVVPEAHIKFALRDSWDPEPFSPNQGNSQLTIHDPLTFEWKRTPILDIKGREVSAGLNMMVFNMPTDWEFSELSPLLLEKRGWPTTTSQDTLSSLLKLPEARVYQISVPMFEELVMEMVVIHTVNQGRFMELILSATDEIYPYVDSEFRSILHSLTLTSP